MIRQQWHSLQPCACMTVAHVVCAHLTVQKLHCYASGGRSNKPERFGFMQMCTLQLIHSGLSGGTRPSCSLLHPIPGLTLVTKKLQAPTIPHPHSKGALLLVFNKSCDYLVRSRPHNKFVYVLPMDLKVPG